MFAFKLFNIWEFRVFGSRFKVSVTRMRTDFTIDIEHDSHSEKPIEQKECK